MITYIYICKIFPFIFAVQQDYELDISHLKRFSYRELQLATSNFSSKNILGQGGYGVVYKGCLPNRTLVAVKRLRDPNFTGEVQFQTEVEMIGLALHRNLLRLFGFCMTTNERLLVYPYMPNGSVADRLRGLFHFLACTSILFLFISLYLYSNPIVILKLRYCRRHFYVPHSIKIFILPTNKIF